MALGHSVLGAIFLKKGESEDSPQALPDAFSHSNLGVRTDHHLGPHRDGILLSLTALARFLTALNVRTVSAIGLSPIVLTKKM